MQNIIWNEEYYNQVVNCVTLLIHRKDDSFILDFSGVLSYDGYDKYRKCDGDADFYFCRHGWKKVEN